VQPLSVPPKIEVVSALPGQAPVLDNLLQLYAHDFSEFHDVQFNDQGRFVYKQLPLYFNEAGRHALLVRVDGKLAGFVLVKRGSEVSDDAAVWDMAEFFVVRGKRRHGVGTHIAHEVWKRLPGTWEVRVMIANPAAISFWERAIAALLGATPDSHTYVEHGEQWRVFRFESK
jgi:predicted acetyltransferase